MKALGIISLVFACLNLIAAIVVASSGYADAAGTKFAGALLAGALGGFFLYQANKKKEEAEKKEQWENNKKSE